MARKTKAEAEQTREALLDAAEALFFEKGVARTTLEEICRSAGLTRGALYWHFRNKADVLTALIERVTLPVDTLLTEIAEADPGPSDLLAQTRAVFLRVFQELAEDIPRRRVFTILLQGTELMGEMKPIQDLFDEKGATLERALCRILERCRDKGEVLPCIDPMTAARSLHALLIGIHMLALRGASPLDLSHDTPKMIDLFFDGLTAA